MAHSNFGYDNNGDSTIIDIHPALRDVPAQDYSSPLPTYNEVIHPETAVPPTYESLYGRPVENEARSSFCDTYRTAFSKSIKFCTGGILNPLLMFALAIPTQIPCALSGFSSLMLMIGGILTLTKAIFEMIVKMCIKPQDTRSFGVEIILRSLNSVIVLWLVVLTTVIAAAIIQSSYVDPFRSTSECSNMIFIFTFWLLTAYYCSLVCVIVFSFLVAVAIWLCS